MKKIESLTDLRKYLCKLGNEFSAVFDAHTAPDGRGRLTTLTGWKDLRIVVVGSGEGVRCCARKDKAKDEKELCTIRKPSIQSWGKPVAWDYRPKGLTSKEWHKITPRCAAWLEKKGLYIHRETITDKTGLLFEVKNG